MADDCINSPRKYPICRVFFNSEILISAVMVKIRSVAPSVSRLLSCDLQYDRFMMQYFLRKGLLKNRSVRTHLIEMTSKMASRSLPTIKTLPF